MTERRIAVVLFNLGGPDRREAVRPFLYNLFSDPAIIRLPAGLRHLLAWVIARRRAPIAEEIYEALGGGSPILPNTETQAAALDAALGPGFKSFIAMRYWHPRAIETVRTVRDWGATDLVLAPLYPQYSSTTTGSSLQEWHAVARLERLELPTRTLCCWPVEPGFVGTVVERVEAAIAEMDPKQAVRVLFSAHGLPKRIVEAGDPYQAQVERTAKAIAARLPADLDTVVCYQSRVGPLEWLGPATDAEVRRAGEEGVGLIVVPIAFVSEHSETLVELDIEYRRLAADSGVPFYRRLPTVDADPHFISALANQIKRLAGRAPGIESGVGHRLCDEAARLCPCRSAA